MKAQQILNTAIFDIGDEVEFAIRSGKDFGLVQHIIICPGGLLYEVVWSNKSIEKHYDFELVKKANRQ